MNAFEEKAFKKLTLVRPLNQIHFNRQNYQKQEGPGNGDQIVVLHVTKQVQKFFSLFMYYLTKFNDVM